MNWKRTKVNLEIVLKGHILNWPWRGHLERRRRRGEVTRKAVCEYLEPFVPESIPEDASTCLNHAGNPERTRPDGENGERIFTIWLQGEDRAPEIVKACIGSIRHNCKAQLVVLDSESLAEWISLPDYIIRKWKEGKIRPAHFADICRVELLYRYGGVWMDATCFATSDIPAEIMDEDFFIYLSGDRLKGSYSFVQNCFFRSVKGSYLIRAWREAIFNYWKAEDSIIDYFAHQLLFRLTVVKNHRAARLFGKMPHVVQDPTHELWFGHRDEAFDKEEFARLTGGAFYQKTEYKSKSAREPVPGSYADVMRKMY